MRIIAGKMKGFSLFIPLDKRTRPLKDMVRESIFNLLIHSNKISFELEKSNILDLFSGSGSFGLECLSRKASFVSFVEKEKNITKILKKNIKKLNLNKKTKIFPFDVMFFLKKKIAYKYNLIFCDPPFENNNIENLIELIFINKYLKKDGIMIIHRNKNTEDNIPACFHVIDERIYGNSKIIFGKFLF